MGSVICKICGREMPKIGSVKGLCNSCYKKEKRKDPEYRARGRASTRTCSAKNKKANMDYLESIGATKCFKCGYSKCFAALDLHHLNPEEKKGEYDSLGMWLQRSSSYFRDKLSSCGWVMLCANCHREIHNQEN